MVNCQRGKNGNMVRTHRVKRLACVALGRWSRWGRERGDDVYNADLRQGADLWVMNRFRAGLVLPSVGRRQHFEEADGCHILVKSCSYQTTPAVRVQEGCKDHL